MLCILKVITNNYFQGCRDDDGCSNKEDGKDKKECYCAGDGCVKSQKVQDPIHTIEVIL